jgi:hypothetical protein
MAQFAPGLEQKIAANPDAPHNVIVRVDGDLDARQQQLAARGLQIRRKLALIKGFAFTASGSSIRQLAALPWVTSIEEDQQVHTMNQ